MRKLKRAVAKRRMKAAGVQGACKKRAWGSYFSQCWREWCRPISRKKRKKRPGRRRAEHKEAKV